MHTQCLCYSAPALSQVLRGDNRKHLYLSFPSEWKISLLYGLPLSAVGKLIHSPSGLHLANLQSNPCKSIQLEVNGRASSCQLQTGLHPAESWSSSSSADREGLSEKLTRGVLLH